MVNPGRWVLQEIQNSGARPIGVRHIIGILDTVVAADVTNNFNAGMEPNGQVNRLVRRGNKYVRFEEWIA